jgi:hypothetical protein
MEAMPYFTQGNGGDEKVSRVLSTHPRKIIGVGAGLSQVANSIRVQHEIHSRKGFTRSSGIRGGSQSVVPRTESCQSLNFCFLRANALCRDLRRGRVADLPLVWSPSNQPNNSRAWRADSFLTFLTAISTALIRDILRSEQAGDKRVSSTRRRANNWHLIGGRDGPSNCGGAARLAPP